MGGAEAGQQEVTEEQIAGPDGRVALDLLARMAPTEWTRRTAADVTVGAEQETAPRPTDWAGVDGPSAGAGGAGGG
jgi:hypothetical protein